MRSRKETHKKEPVAWFVIRMIVRGLIGLGAIGSGIDWLIKIFKMLTRF